MSAALCPAACLPADRSAASARSPERCNADWPCCTVRHACNRGNVPVSPDHTIIRCVSALNIASMGTGNQRCASGGRTSSAGISGPAGCLKCQQTLPGFSQDFCKGAPHAGTASVSALADHWPHHTSSSTISTSTSWPSSMHEAGSLSPGTSHQLVARSGS